MATRTPRDSPRVRTRATTGDDLDLFVTTVHQAFGAFPETPADSPGRWWSALELDRGILAHTTSEPTEPTGPADHGEPADHGGRPVGTTASYTFDLTLPGPQHPTPDTGPENPLPTISVAGVTSVGVLPTHRRQGVLTAMMRHQLTDLRERGEPLAVLLASEATIYGRFGYGPATHTTQITVPRHRNALAAPRAHTLVPPTPESRETKADNGTVEIVHRDTCGDILETLYDQYRRHQPGALSRPHHWWARRAGRPPISCAPRYIALHRDHTGTPDGYASYTLDQGTLTVDETITTTTSALTALHHFTLNHDLTQQTVLKHVPRNHPLRTQLSDTRAAQVTNDTDWLWVRILDIPRALTTRGWGSTDADLVLDVHDPFLHEHTRHHLHTHNGHATCEPTDRDPDLTLDIRDLGSLYLSGTTPSTLIHAGHIHPHHPEAAALADAVFDTGQPPHCLHWF
ncbi:GNAT family N-acetyltransferase [Kineosporia succinea]|uniref:Acetyltransferase n=1 Tax=Kineosporia succinea TaxID=84632 RepID=A0ABT9PC22_9ACTN|nr:GNAT family N-acetyltransferase [Kineosporia succinea]MDP9829949.1 putative acetyltransferase [Kineosporia succinea]